MPLEYGDHGESEDDYGLSKIQEPVLTREELRRLKRAVGALNRLIADIRERLPEAEYYLDGSNSLNILSGPSHDNSIEAHAQPEKIMAAEHVEHCNGGDW